MCDLNLAQCFHSGFIHELSSLATLSFAQYLAHDSGCQLVALEFKQQQTGWISLLRTIELLLLSLSTTIHSPPTKI